jgi:NADH dehydrogenase
MSRILVTGANGCVGTCLVEALAAAGHEVTGIDRSRTGGPAPRAGIERLQADVLRPETYAEALRGIDTVIHLAAATGRSKPRDHFEINATGTETLLRQCHAAGVTRFVFVSSIAVKFPDKRRYPYALAKAHAEEAVQASGLDFTIVRPTIVIGRGSGTLAGMRKLAGLPRIPVFGSGRVLVQPIWVGDLADLLIATLERYDCVGATLELGGPEALTIEELLRAIGRIDSAKERGVIRIPLGPLLPLLAGIESLGLRLPVTVGQLASFRFDGTIDPSPLHDGRRDSLKRVPEMLSLAMSE